MCGKELPEFEVLEALPLSIKKLQNLANSTPFASFHKRLSKKCRFLNKKC